MSDLPQGKKGNLAVHLQDVDVVGKAVEQGAGQPFTPMISVHSSNGSLPASFLQPFATQGIAAAGH